MAILDVTYFNADLTNKINGTAPGPRPGTFTSVNLPGESTREGVEVAARFKLTRELTLGGAYTYTDARNPDGERELRRPPHAGKRGPRLRLHAAGAARPPSAPSTTAARRTSRSGCRSSSRPQRVALDAYWLLNATASYKLQPGVEVFGRVENLLDQHYQEVYGYRCAADCGLSRASS